MRTALGFSHWINIAGWCTPSKAVHLILSFSCQRRSPLCAYSAFRSHNGCERRHLCYTRVRGPYAERDAQQKLFLRCYMDLNNPCRVFFPELFCVCLAAIGSDFFQIRHWTASSANQVVAQFVRTPAVSEDAGLAGTPAGKKTARHGVPEKGGSLGPPVVTASVGGRE